MDVPSFVRNVDAGDEMPMKIEDGIVVSFDNGMVTLMYPYGAAAMDDEESDFCFIGLYVKVLRVSGPG